MKAKLTRIHLGLGMTEIGVQFETLDDANQKTSTQRAFLVVDEAILAPVWLAVQLALTAKLGELPLDMPPGNVTTALMQQRAAEQATKDAQQALAEAQARLAEVEAQVAQVTAKTTGA